MKRTTYILIGIFLANILLALSGLVYLRMTMFSNNDMTFELEFSDEYTSMDFDDVHTLKVLIPAMHDGNYSLMNPGMVNVSSSSEENKTTVIYPKSDCIKLNKENGILEVILIVHSDSLAGENHSKERISLKNLNLWIESGKKLERINSDWGMDLILQQMQLKDLDLIANSVKLDSCTIDSLSLDVDRFETINSTMHTLRLEKMGWTKFKDSKVETLHIIGRDDRRYQVPNGDFSRIVWEPRNDKAKLSMELKGNAEVIMNN